MQKIKFSITVFFSKCDHSDLVTFTKENLNGKLDFLYSDWKEFRQRDGTDTKMINAFQANVPILYSLKTPKNQSFSGVFRGYEMRTLGLNGLNNF